MPVEVKDVIESYADYLRAAQSHNLEHFTLLRKSDSEGALAEAIVFAMLQHLTVHPEVHEQAGTGGVDFICSRPCGPLIKSSARPPFMVEATSLNPGAVTERSHIPNEVPDDIRGGAFGLLIRNILNKAKAKATQLANYPMPRVLAIVSSHFAATVLFDRLTAKYALVSEPHWKQEIGSSVADPNQYTDLEESAFIKPSPNGTVVACRQSISAILLVAVYGDKSDVYRILHPQPAYPLNVEFLPGIPFIRIMPWPITDGEIFTEWVVGNPDACAVPHFPIDPWRKRQTETKVGRTRTGRQSGMG
jgi:hypothetical protein